MKTPESAAVIIRATGGLGRARTLLSSLGWPAIASVPPQIGVFARALQRAHSVSSAIVPSTSNGVLRYFLLHCSEPIERIRGPFLENSYRASFVLSAGMLGKSRPLSPHRGAPYMLLSSQCLPFGRHP